MPKPITLLSHLQYHEDVLNREIIHHHDLLVGPSEDNGLCADVKAIKAGFKNLKSTIYVVGIPLILSIIGDIISRFLR